MESIFKSGVASLWSTWGAWSQCSRTCGTGQRTRQRKCNDEDRCPGFPDAGSESQDCNQQSCPGTMIL